MRATVAEKIRDALTDGGIRTIGPIAGGRPSWLRVGAFLNDAQLESFRRLGARRSYPIPLNEHPAMIPLLVAPQKLAGASELAEKVATFPCHHRVTAGDIQVLRRLAASVEALT